MLALVGLPFLLPWHFKPLVGFHAEWAALLAGCLLMAAMVLNPSPRRGFDLPVTAAGFAAIGAVVLAQSMIGLLPYAEEARIVILYMVWALAMMMVGTWRCERVGETAAAAELATGLVIAALGNVLVAVMSMAGWESPLIGRFQGGALYGNLGQANHYADLLWLGIAAAVYLHQVRKIGGIAALAILLVLMTASSTTGSRASLVYASFLTLLYLRSPAGRLRPGVFAGLVLYFAAARWLPGWLASSFDIQGTRSPILRAAVESAPESAIRPTLWREAWNLFAEHPWLGGGWGSFRAWTWESGDRAGVWKGGAEHAHNLFAHLLAETGLPLTLIVVALLGRWAWLTWRERADPVRRFAFAAAGIAMLHSQIEYPLWYAFFIGVFALLLSLGAERRIVLPLRRSLAALVVVAGVGVLGVVAKDYYQLLRLIHTPIAAGHEERARAQLQELIDLRKGSVLAPWVDMSLLGVMAPTRDDLAAKSLFCQSSLSFSPSWPGTFNCALVAELEGDTTRADRIWHLATTSAGPEVRDGYVALQRSVLERHEVAELARFLGPASVSP